MKLIYVSPFLRIPPDFGLGIRNYYVLKHLTEKYSVFVITYGLDETGETDRWLSAHCVGFQRLALLRPNPNRLRNTRLGTFQRVCSFPPASFQKYDSAILIQCLDRSLMAHPDTDVIFFDTQLTGQALLKKSFEPTCVLSLADVYAVQYRRHLKMIGWRPFTFVYLMEWFKTKLFEHRICQRYQHLITVSTDECQIVRAYNPRADVIVVPNGVDTEMLRGTGAQLNHNALLFVASFDYGPNVDAFLYFCREVLPLIRQQKPDVKFVAVGRKPTSLMQEMAKNEPNIIVTGTVTDVSPYYSQSALVVIPLRYGSGTKLKTLEAFALGVPVVSTTIGCEGIDVQNGRHLIVADTPEIFSQQVLRLLDHPEEAQILAKQARQLVESRYDWKALTLQLEDYLLHTVEKQKQVR